MPRKKSSHCKWGHEFTKENTRIQSNGFRRCVTCHRLESVKYNKINAQKRHDAKVEKKYEKYGLSAQEFDSMLIEQNNTCAICKETSKYTLCVDHDHQTGKVRGLLCRTCNLGLGLFKDNWKIAVEASNYLVQHKENVFIYGGCSSTGRKLRASDCDSEDGGSTPLSRPRL